MHPAPTRAGAGRRARTPLDSPAPAGPAQRTRRRPLALALGALLTLAACQDEATAPGARPATRPPAVDGPRLTVVGDVNVTAQDIGSPFGTHSTARAINDHGDVVGEAAGSQAAPRSGFLWDDGAGEIWASLQGNVRRVNDIDPSTDFIAGQTADGKAFVAPLWAPTQALADLPGTTVAEAFAVNGAGVAVGVASGSQANPDADLPADADYAVVWSCPACAPTQLSFRGGGGRGRARDVNGAGQIVGSVVDQAGRWRAFRWSNGEMRMLGTLGGAESHAEAINEAGHVAGWSTTAGGETHAFFWKNGVMTDLGTLGGSWSRAYGINDHDEVVGAAALIPHPPYLSRAFLWRDGAMTNLSPEGGYDTRAFDINDDRRIVGQTHPTVGSAHHATVWTVTPLVAQSISWPLVGDRTLGDAPFTLAATAPGGPVTYTLGASSVGCALSGPNNATVTLTAITPVLSACQIVAHQAGNDVYEPAASVLHTFRIRYPFAFAAPIDAPGAGPTHTVNSLKAGFSVPVRFTLGGAHGLSVFVPNSPVVHVVPCGTFVEDKLEETRPPNAVQALSYDPGRGEYVYTWNTQAAWAGGCRRLTLKLNDGTEQEARFFFK